MSSKTDETANKAKTPETEAPETPEIPEMTEAERSKIEQFQPGALAQNAGWSGVDDAGSEIYKRVDLGCGPKGQGRFQVGEDWIRVDENPAFKPDVVADLTKYPWPFEDNEVLEVQAAHVVEHLDDWVGFFKEMYRICAHGAVVRVVGPLYNSEKFWADPTHKRPLTRRFFAYLSAKGRAILEVSHTGLEDVDFETEMMRPVIDPKWEGKSDDAREWGMQHYNNVVDELDVFLRVYKPKREVDRD